MSKGNLRLMSVNAGAASNDRLPSNLHVMSTNTTLEEQPAAVEAAIAELQKQIPTSPSPNWLQQITGAFKDEPAFEDVFADG